MTLFLAMIFGLTIGTSAGLKHCERVLSQSQFEAEGGNLLEIKGLSSQNLGRDLGCSSGPCVGANTQHALVSEDGTVVSTGADRVYGNGVSNVFVKRIEKMRYAPPRLAGKPVCVSFDVTWDGGEPEVLRRVRK